MHGFYGTIVHKYIHTFSTVHIPHIFAGADMGGGCMSLWPAIYTHINKPVFSTLLRTLRATLHTLLKIKCISTGIQVGAAHCLKIRLYSAWLILKSIGFSLNHPWLPPPPHPYAVPMHPLPFLGCRTPSISLELYPCSLSSPSSLTVKTPPSPWIPLWQSPLSPYPLPWL